MALWVAEKCEWSGQAICMSRVYTVRHNAVRVRLFFRVVNNIVSIRTQVRRFLITFIDAEITVYDVALLVIRCVDWTGIIGAAVH